MRLQALEVVSRPNSNAMRARGRRVFHCYLVLLCLFLLQGDIHYIHNIHSASTHRLSDFRHGVGLFWEASETSRMSVLMQSRSSGGIGVTAVSVLRNSHSRHSAHFTLDQGSKTNNGSASTSTRAQGGLRAKFHTGSINKSHSTRNTDDESDSLRAVLLERRARATIRADKADRALSSRALTAPSQASGTAPESDTSDTITPLMKAIIDHDNDKVLRLVSNMLQSNDVTSQDMQDAKGKTALMYACKLDNLEAAKALVMNGADPHLKTTGSVLLFGYDQKDALGYAEQSRDAELIDLLKDYTKYSAEYAYTASASGRARIRRAWALLQFEGRLFDGEFLSSLPPAVRETMDRDEVEFLPRFQVEERLGKRGNFESLEPMMRARCAALAGYGRAQLQNHQRFASHVHPNEDLLMLVNKASGRQLTQRDVLGFVFTEVGECRHPTYKAVPALKLICATPSRPEKDAISKGTKKRKSVSVGKYLMWGYLHGLLQSRHSYGILELASGYKNLPGYCMYSKFGFRDDGMIRGPRCFDNNNLPMVIDLQAVTHDQIDDVVTKGASVSLHRQGKDNLPLDAFRDNYGDGDGRVFDVHNRWIVRGNDPICNLSEQEKAERAGQGRGQPSDYAVLRESCNRGLRSMKALFDAGVTLVPMSTVFEKIMQDNGLLLVDITLSDAGLADPHFAAKLIRALELRSVQGQELVFSLIEMEKWQAEALLRPSPHSGWDVLAEAKREREEVRDEAEIMENERRESQRKQTQPEDVSNDSDSDSDSDSEDANAYRNRFAVLDTYEEESEDELPPSRTSARVNNALMDLKQNSLPLASPSPTSTTTTTGTITAATTTQTTTTDAGAEVAYEDMLEFEDEEES